MAKKLSRTLKVLAAAVLSPKTYSKTWGCLQQALADGDSLHQQLADLKKKSDCAILDAYVTEPPSYDLAFKLFEGEWSSIVPGYGGGHAGLFDDGRIHWFGEQCGGFQGKRVLELGPLEGAHTSMIANAGAASVTAIESNTRAFLKCLIVQNALKFKADFRLGDFRLYLDNCAETYDVLIASGVLYHMPEPVALLTNAARVSNSIGLWTHYYDPEVVEASAHIKRRFESTPRTEQVGGRQIVSYKYSYLEALQWKGFCGGSAPFSYWLTRDSLLGLLEDLGFTVAIHEDTKTHPNGPAITLFASRR